VPDNPGVQTARCMTAEVLLGLVSDSEKFKGAVGEKSATH